MMEPEDLAQLGEAIQARRERWTWANLPSDLQRLFTCRLARVVGTNADAETWWGWMDVPNRRHWRWMAENPIAEEGAYSAEVERINAEVDEATCEAFRVLKGMAS